MPRSIVIFGCGGQGREIAAIAMAIAEQSGDGPTVLGFLDDDPSPENVQRVERLGLRLLGPSSVMPQLPPGTGFVVGIADGEIRERLAGWAEDLGFVATTLIHPDATVAWGCTLGAGTVVWPGARISAQVRLGRHVHVNQNATVGHDTVAEDFVTINPSAAVSGCVHLGLRSLVGAGSVVLQGRDVGTGATVGAAACVVRDVAPDAVVMGVPARHRTESQQKAGTMQQESPPPRAIEPPRGKLAVIGQGYVGLPLAIRAVEVGWNVVGLDVDESRVERLRSGESYVEDITDAALVGALDTGRYTPSADYAACSDFDVAVISVPTPLREGNPDLSYIEDASRSLARLLRPGAAVVLESTTYPGTTEELVAPILEAGSGLILGKDFSLGYSPERIDPGNPIWTLVTTPKVVSGVDNDSLKAVQSFYDTIVDRTVPVASPKEAELTKLLENTFRHVNIALVNELAMFAHDLGIDVWEAIDAASTKPFGYMRFTPGPGVGGHCLPIDPSYLSWQVKRTLGQPFRFVELANDVNDHMPDYIVRRIIALLNDKQKPVSGSRILLLGLAYKKNTGDARESPARRIAELLMTMGASVSAVDSHIDRQSLRLPISLITLEKEHLAASDLVVVLTDHDDVDYQFVETYAAHLLDTRKRTIGVRVEHL